MIKVIVFAVAVLTSLFAHAQQDSVAVFHRPERVVVLINEFGQFGRLQDFMNAVSAGAELHILSADESIKIDCGRTQAKASCTFRFLPSQAVEIGARSVAALSAGTDLQIPLPAAFAMTFESSRQDTFSLQIENELLKVIAAKKPR